MYHCIFWTLFPVNVEEPFEDHQFYPLKIAIF